MTTYYKCVRPDGTDFHTGSVQWAPPEGHEGEWIVRHHTAKEVGRDASEYLSVSTVVTNCTGMRWPCRLLTVEAVGDVALSAEQPHKRAGVTFRVTGELPAHEVFGPQGSHVVALIERARHLTPDEACTLAAMRDGGAVWVAAWNAAWGAAGDAARDAAWAAVGSAAWVAARNAVWDVAGALIVRDLINTRQYDALTGYWRRAIGPIHPDDPELPSDRSPA